MASDFDDAWSKISGTAPIAHQLKERLTERWVRFHSLPDAKRYPETAQEREEVFARANAILTRCYRNGGGAVLVTGQWGQLGEEPPPVSKEQLAVHSSASYWREEQPDAETVLHLWASNEHDPRTTLRPLIERTSEWELTEALLILPAAQVALHPYDGGIDAIMATQIERNALATRFNEWLSPLPTGL